MYSELKFVDVPSTKSPLSGLLETKALDVLFNLSTVH